MSSFNSSFNARLRSEEEQEDRELTFCSTRCRERGIGILAYVQFLGTLERPLVLRFCFLSDICMQVTRHYRSRSQ